MLDRIVQFTSRYNMFVTGCRVGVAVSGGIDSVVLLHALGQLRPRLDVQLSIVHVNHMLRGESSLADEEFVADLARGAGLAFHHTRLLPLHGNVEQAAREARLGYFRSLLAEGSLDRIATGHTASDQAETVLFRFLRGTGPAGLAGILPVTNEGIVRPMLTLTREQVEAYAQQYRLQWRTDESNLSRQYARNRIRHDLIPLLKETCNPSLTVQLSQTAAIALDEEHFWGEYLAPLAEQHLCETAGAIVVDCRRLARLPIAVQRRLLRLAFARAKGDLRQIEFAHVEVVRSLSATLEGSGRAQLPGLDVMRSFDWLRISPLPAPPVQTRFASALIEIPGETRLPGGAAVIATVENRPETRYTEERNLMLDPEDLATPLVLRYWLPGDAYQPVGYARVEKLKQLFQSARIPLWERRFWPIIENRTGILWSRRFGPSQASLARLASSSDSAADPSHARPGLVCVREI